MASFEALIQFPINMKFSFEFMVWIEKNLCIILESWVIAVESSHQVLEGTSVRFDSKYTKTKPVIRHLPFFFEPLPSFQAIFLIMSQLSTKVTLIIAYFLLMSLNIRVGLICLVWFMLYALFRLPPLSLSSMTYEMNWMLFKLLKPCLFLIKHIDQLIPIPLILHNVVINLKRPILRRQRIQDELHEKELIHIHPESL